MQEPVKKLLENLNAIDDGRRDELTVTEEGVLAFINHEYPKEAAFRNVIFAVVSLYTYARARGSADILRLFEAIVSLDEQLTLFRRTCSKCPEKDSCDKRIEDCQYQPYNQEKGGEN